MVMTFATHLLYEERSSCKLAVPSCSGDIMSSALLRILLPLLIFTLTIRRSDGQYEEWCIADEQTPDDVLQRALDWACANGADCSKIQENEVCFFPDTVKDHASYAFNNYYQRFKNEGASCYFNAAAMVTDLDPSHDSCKFGFLP